jgi:hypothetical protein
VRNSFTADLADIRLPVLFTTETRKTRKPPHPSSWQW